MSELSTSHWTAAFGSGGAERVPCGQQLRVVLVQAVLEPAERALALDGLGETAPGSLVTDALGEVDHVLVPRPGRQRLDREQTHFVEVDRRAAIDPAVRYS